MSRVVLFICCIVALFGPASGAATYRWCDGLEGLSGSDWVYNWHGSGNVGGVSIDNTMAYSGQNSLRMFGLLASCWGVVLTHPLQMLSESEVTVAVRNGNEQLSGCHPYRGAISVRSGGPDWWNCPCPSLLTFLPNGDIRINSDNGSVYAVFPGYPLETWHLVRMQFRAPDDDLLHIKIWVNGGLLGEFTWPWEPWMLEQVYMDISAQEGTAWFDDICISSIPAVQNVDLDIKPGSCPNPLNLKVLESTDEVIGTGADQDAVVVEQVVASKAVPQSGRQSQSVVPVAILGTPGFDPRGIKVSTLRLEGVPAIRYGFEDVSTPMSDGVGECACQTLGPDGLMDLTLKFNKAALLAALGPVLDRDEVTLTLTGEMEDGMPIEGSDCVLIRGGTEATSLSASVTAVPNPANPTTSFHIMSDHPSAFDLEIYNVQGQRVWAASGVAQAGETVVHWDGRNNANRPAATGVYFYRVRTDAYEVQKKLLMLK